MGEPSGYLTLHRQGGLAERVRLARQLLQSCRVCPHGCGVDRTAGESGACQVGAKARVSSYGPHFGEESPLVGRHGSGTIFFEGCNLHCVFCQNYEISQIDDRGDGAPEATDGEQLAAVMLNLQKQGCHNINLVTPSHVIPQILEAVAIAAENGLELPLVYNSSGYDSVPALRFLEGVVDIYMPDCKFWSEETAARYTSAANYPRIMRQAVAEMHRQVGDLVIDKQGLAVRGLLVRHLVMPGHVEETGHICRFLAEKISANTYVNIMDQYRPCFRAGFFPEIARELTSTEFEGAMARARRSGLSRFDQRDLAAMLKRLLEL